MSNNQVKLNFDELMAQKMPVIREYAAQRGLGCGFGEKKADLVARIVEVQETLQPKTKEEPVPTEPKSELLRTKPPAKNVTQKEIKEACQHFIDRGLKLEFPEDDQFHMKYGLKEDSGNIRTSLRTLVKRAEILCR